MSPRIHPRSTVRHALWLGGLLIILGGLFGMHGLDNHGDAGMDTIAGAFMPVAHNAAAGHEAMTTTVHEAAAVTDASGHADMDMGSAGMCVAVLVFVLIALFLRLHGGRLRPLLWRFAPTARAPGVRGRDPDPPSLIRLSIQRC